MRELAALLLLSTTVFAAPPELLKIQGKVEEFGLGAGLAGVEVFVDRYDEKPLSSLTPKKQVAASTTSSTGTFSFEFDKSGTYRVTVQKEGYLLPGSFMDGYNHSAEFALDATTPTKELTFHFARPAEVSGTVIDLETELPVEGVPINIGQFGHSAGQRFLTPASPSAITGPQGRFTLSGLVPSAHVLMVGPRLRSPYDLRSRPELKKLGIEDRFLPEFTDKDREAIDMDYETTYWPGGSSLANAAPFTLPSASKIDLGILGVRKVAKYRVVVSLAGSSCEGIDKANVSVKSTAFATPILGSIPCGGSALFRGFSPGEYEFEVVATNKPGKPDLTATAKVQVDHGPSQIAIPLLPGAKIAGSVVPADGAKFNSYDGIRLLLQPTAYGAIRHGLIPIDSAGKFSFENVAMREYRLRASGVPETHYLQQVLYNGIPIADQRITLNTAAPAHSLELIFDDKPAAITGTVTASSKPLASAHIVVVPWPAPPGVELFISQRTATANEKGRFSIAGLAPGDYRILAVPPDQKRSLQTPNELERLLSNAETLTLTKRQLKTLNLTP
jgi:hypothetical protein